MSMPRSIDRGLPIPLMRCSYRYRCGRRLAVRGTGRIGSGCRLGLGGGLEGHRPGDGAGDLGVTAVTGAKNAVRHNLLPRRPAVPAKESLDKREPYADFRKAN